MSVQYSIAFAALIGGAPVAAQSTNNAVATTPPPATTTPPPAATGNSVGPPQLRDFSLGGTVTRPADTPPVVEGEPAPAGTTTRAAPVERTTAPRATDPRPSDPVSRAPVIVAEDRGAPVSGVPDPLSSDSALTDPSFGQPPALDPIATPLADDEPAKMWPWLAALLALVLGGGYLWWRRQQRQVQQRFAGEQPGPGALVTARDAAPSPRPQPRPAPGPAPAPTPTPDAGYVTARPRPAPVPVPNAPPTPPAPVGIVASGLKPRIELELIPGRVEVNAAGGAAVTVEIVVINRGSAPARDVLVEAQLINAGPAVNADVGRFFEQPPGRGERVPSIKPMGSVTVRMRLAVDAAQIAPLVVDGRKLLVPLVAINAFYRWSGGELTDAASFLVGRGEADAAKLAPFRLDLGARSWSGLAARLHSHGLQRA